MGFGRSENLGHEQKGRIIFLGALFFLLFILIIVKLFNLQIINQRIYSRRAQEVAQRSSGIPARRGRIFDRHHDIPMADNRDSFRLYLIPAETTQVGGPSEIMETLKEILGPKMDMETIESKLPSHWRDSYLSIEIASDVSYEELIPLAENIEDFPGLHWESRPYRFYNEIGSISHILGYVGNITLEEWQLLYNQGYSNDAVIGKSGIERVYDSLMKGQDGFFLRTVDVKGRDIMENELSPPVNGLDLVLTVDREIQALAESALGERKGSVVVLRPSTGEVLAMVSYPYYNPNLFFEEGENSFSQLSLNRDFPFLNRSIQSAYAPASTFKVLMTFGLIAEGWNANSFIHCSGSMELGDREFHCHKLTGHGSLNLYEALAESCNIYFGTAGMDFLGMETMAYYSRLLGLGTVSGIDLLGESNGLIPDPQWKEEIYHTPWTGGDTLNATVGQGFISVTPLQMANLMAMIVNDGKLYRPHILDRAIDPQNGETVLQHSPELIRDISDQIEPWVFEETRRAMREVITDGTAQVAIMNNVVDIAGKTGTGEIGSDENYHAWFVSYGPYNAAPEEQLVVVCQVEAYNEVWDWWAIKASDMIYQGIFGNQTYSEVVESMRNRWVWYVRDIPEETEDE